MSSLDISSQNEELKILESTVSFLDSHNLNYYLACGTLLGAVRHKGFIPWDDDIDVTMPRPDYEKLLQLNREKSLWPQSLELCSFEDGTLNSPYMKLFDRTTKIVEENYSQDDVRSLWIDIFPVDGVPADRKERVRHYRKALNLCKLNVASVVKNGYGSSTIIIILKDLFLKPLAKIIGRKKIAEMQKKFALKYPYEQSALCGMVTWAYDGPDQALTREEYEDLVELPFEDHLFYATSAWDKNLSGIFGDYMQLPPESERITHDLEAYRL